MSETVYNTGKYLHFSGGEIIGLLATALFASFALTFNDWGGDAFDVAAGAWMLFLVTVFLLFVFFVTVAACKFFAIKMNYKIHYVPHKFGLGIGLLVTVGSAGFLPFFLPGGFVFDRPERMMVGRWRSFYKDWELGVISALFPLLILLWALVISPLYAVSGEDIYLRLLLGVLLTAVYACIPMPMVQPHKTGKFGNFFEFLHGSSFGLDVLWGSIYWYATLIIFALLFSLLAYLLTFVGLVVGIFLYAILLFMVGTSAFIYSQFMKS